MERMSIEIGLRSPQETSDRDRLHVGGDHVRRYDPRPGGDYCPTPEEIAAECHKIQNEWSERERWRRAGYSEGRPMWEVPTHQVASLSAG
jgi:hypothetical protein